MYKKQIKELNMLKRKRGFEIKFFLVNKGKTCLLLALYN